MAIIFLIAIRTGGKIIFHLIILEEHHQKTVAAVELKKIRQLPLHADTIGKTRIEHQERTLADVQVYPIYQGRIVGFGKAGLLAIENLQDVLHMAGVSGGWHEILETGAEGYDARLVFLAHRHIRKHQRGVDGIIQISHPPESLLHHPTLVDDAEHLLRTLVLIHVHHQTGGAGGDLPVDEPEIITRHIIPDLFKLGMIAHTANLLDAEFG